jgi:hypothetical protein
MVAISHGIKDLQLKAEKRKQPYKNIFQSIKSIVQAEGIRGLQKGLTSALAFQFCKRLLPMRLILRDANLLQSHQFLMPSSSQV